MMFLSHQLSNVFNFRGGLNLEQIGWGALNLVHEPNIPHRGSGVFMASCITMPTSSHEEIAKIKNDSRIIPLIISLAQT